MVISHIHFEVPPCCQGSPNGGSVQRRAKPKVSDEKYGSGTQLPRCWRVPGAAPGSCLAGRCRWWCRPRLAEEG